MLEHKELVIMAAEAIFALIFFIVKKKPNKVISPYMYEAIKWLMAGIKGAEEIIGKGHGEDKKKYALEYVKEMMTKTIPEIDFSQYEKYIVQWLEYILETPQKKGDSK